MATPSKPSPLETLLDDQQRKAFAEYLIAKIESVRNQLDAEFVPKRRRFEKEMLDDFSWRNGGSDRGSRLYDTSVDDLVNGIFDLQNDSANIVGGFAAFMTARTADDIFGTDPYYSINPEGMADDVLAQAMQRHSEWKLRSSSFKDAALDAIDLAFGLGEGVLKISWETDLDVYETVEEVLTGPDGKAIVTLDGDYIGREDITMGVDPATGAPAIVVPKDPTLPPFDPASVTWTEQAIEKTNVSYRGIRANVMHYGDFLCPLTEESVECSPFLGHRFQMRLSEARSRMTIPPELLAQMGSDSLEAKTAQREPNDTLGESPENEVQSRQQDPIVEFVECWVKYDPVGDGRIRRMRVVVAPQHKGIVEMDYMANVTPMGQVPFFCVRGTKVKNRWYGRGYYEIYEKAQLFIDRQLCRVEYRNKFHSNPVVFFDPSLLLEDEESGDFQMRPGASYRTKQGVEPEKVYHVLTLPDLDERTWEIMQFMIQVIQVRSGVTSAAQGEVSSLPSTSTATGIESIMQSASTLSRLPINNIKGGIEKSLLYGVKLIYANMDRDEVFTYFEGDQQQAGVLMAEQVKNIDMNVRLLLTRFKSRENLESAQKGIEIMTSYVQLPEPEKGPQRPLYVQALKGLGFDQADSIVRQPIQMMIDPATGQPVPAPAAPPAGQPGQPNLSLMPPAAQPPAA